MLRTVGEQATLWESILPAPLWGMPAKLEAVGRLLGDPRFFDPYRAFFHPVLGWPSIPIECYLRFSERPAVNEPSSTSSPPSPSELPRSPNRPASASSTVSPLRERPGSCPSTTLTSALSPRDASAEPVESGYKAQLVDNDDGVIVDHNVEAGNPPDDPCLSPPSKASEPAPVPPRGGQPIGATAKPPWRTPNALHAVGVRYVVLPRKGKPTAARRQIENRRAFKTMVRWRTGCEGRISCAERDFGLARPRIDRLADARTWVAHGIFNHNLVKIAGLPADRSGQRPPSTPPNTPAPAPAPPRATTYRFFRSR